MLSHLRVTSPKSEPNTIHHLPFVVSTQADNFGFICWDFVSEIYASASKQWRWLLFCLWCSKQRKITFERLKSSVSFSEVCCCYPGWCTKACWNYVFLILSNYLHIHRVLPSLPTWNTFNSQWAGSFTCSLYMVYYMYHILFVKYFVFAVGQQEINLLQNIFWELKSQNMSKMSNSDFWMPLPIKHQRER